MKAGERAAIVSELQGFLSRMVWIQEGDFAVDRDLALSDLEHDFAGFLERLKAEPRPCVPICRDCSLEFEFPGQLSHHRGFVHGVFED